MDKYTLMYLWIFIGYPGSVILGVYITSKVSLYFAEKKRKKNLRDMHYFWYGDEDMP